MADQEQPSQPLRDPDKLSASRHPHLSVSLYTPAGNDLSIPSDYARLSLAQQHPNANREIASERIKGLLDMQGLHSSRSRTSDQWHPNANNEIAPERWKDLSKARNSSSLDSQCPRNLNSNDPQPACPLKANRSNASGDRSLKRRCDRTNDLVPRSLGDSRPRNLQPPKASDEPLPNCQEGLTDMQYSLRRPEAEGRQLASRSHEATESSSPRSLNLLDSQHPKNGDLATKSYATITHTQHGSKHFPC
jgi:hypothetical protein